MKIYLKKIFVIVFLVVMSGVLFLSCKGENKNAWGADDEIIVFADSSDFYELEASLLTVFNKVIYTPQAEVLFNLVRKDISQFEQYRKFKNILFISPLDTVHEVSRIVSKMLTEDVRELVMSDSVSVINKHDVWAKNQLVMIIASADLTKLKNNILNSHQDLIYYFQKASDKRLFKSLYNNKYERKDVEAKLLKDYGWMIYVQADFSVALEKKEDNFVWLRRGAGTEIERWIFIHWIENASLSLFHKDSINAIRNRLTEKYYRTADDSGFVKIADDYYSIQETNFLKRYALMTQGLWVMSDATMGGPFVNYTFYDNDTKRLYMLDGSIYAPKFFKKKIIQQLDVTLQSFLTDKEITPERKANLFKELD
jgi:hypothetical protein